MLPAGTARCLEMMQCVCKADTKCHQCFCAKAELVVQVHVQKVSALKLNSVRLVQKSWTDNSKLQNTREPLRF